VEKLGLILPECGAHNPPRFEIGIGQGFRPARLILKRDALLDGTLARIPVLREARHDTPEIPTY